MPLHASVETARLEHLFARQAELTPDATAIAFRRQRISYGELAARADRMSRDLSRCGIGPGVILGISLERTPDLIAALLATLMAGGAYLPLDARNPAERNRFMLLDSGCRRVLTDAASPSFARLEGGILELSNGAVIERGRSVRVEPTAPADLAYLIYTSGSTGKPKGVMLGHGAIHLVAWAKRFYAPEDLARVSATTSLSFDPSIFEIFVPLCTGGAVILKESALEPFAADERPTMLCTAPSVLAELCRADALPASLRVLTVGGETLTRDLARAVFHHHPGLALQNHYGPTEATTCATVARVPRDLKAAPSIGRPVRGAEIVLLDPEGGPCAEGETGEIHIGGPALALGYLNRPEATAQRFVEAPGGRVYRTGDLACWRDGELHFAGRVDRQVKIRGFRIELGEVEAALTGIPQVEDAVVVVRQLARRSRLVAYVQAPRSLTPAMVRDSLLAWLPAYMTPAQVVVLDSLPRLASGKVDLGVLQAPAETPGRSAEAPRGLEKPIIHVFQEVLSRASVGPRESFFDLGGDSLASVEAALRLGEILGYELPPALIHQAPTPRRLSRALEHGRPGATRHITLLQAGEPLPPLFCMADLFGHAFNYLSLASRLGEDRSVYGVTPGPLQDAFARQGDLPALTRSVLDELRRVRPAGPYFIAGYSSGGVLAVDLASALERQGEQVRLILLDAYLHSRNPSVAVVARWALRQAARALRGRPAPALGRALRKSWLGLGPASPPDWIPRSQVAFAARMIRLCGAYAPPEFAGPALLLRAIDGDPIDQLFEDGRMGWAKALTGPAAQVSVQGGHHQFLREPLVQETAQAVKRFLMTST